MPDGALLDPSSVGTHTFTVTAEDVAGNVSSLTHTYMVRYAFTGFLAPVENPPVVNLVQAGRAIPLKFSLSGDHGLDIFPAGYPVSVEVNCDDSAPVNDIESTTTPGGSSLSYDATTDIYHYVWQTDELWEGTCRQVTVRLVDGTDHTALFRLR